MKKIYSDSDNKVLIEWFSYSLFVTFLFLPYILTSKHIDKSITMWLLVMGIVFLLVFINDSILGKRKILLETNTIKSRKDKLVVYVKIILDNLIIENELFHIVIELKELSYYKTFDIKYQTDSDKKFVEFSFLFPEELFSNFDSYLWNLTIRQEDELRDIYYTFSNIQFSSNVEKIYSNKIKKSLEFVFPIQNRFKFKR